MPEMQRAEDGREAIASAFVAVNDPNYQPPAPLRRALKLLDLSKKNILRAVLMGVISLGSSIALAATSAWLIARASQMPPVMLLSVATVGVRTFGIGRGLFRYLERLATHSVALRGMASLRAHIYAHLATGNPQTAATLRSGDLLARVSADVDAVGDVVVRGIIPGLVAAVLSTGSVVFVACFHIPAAIALAMCLILAGGVAPWLAQKAARETELHSSQARAQMSALSHEMVSHSAELSVSGQLDTSFAQLRSFEDEICQATDKSARLEGLAQGISTFALVASALSAAVLGIPSVLDGSLAPVELAVIVLTPLAVFEVLQGLPAAAIQVHTSRTAAARIMKLLDEAGTTPAHSAAGSSYSAHSPIASNAAAGESTLGNDPVELAAQEITSGWPGAPVITDLSITAPPGHCVALVGGSGVGKTTTLMTLAGLLSPHCGKVTLNGIDVRNIDPHELAQHVVFVAEDSHIFETTVLENLRVARGDLSAQEAQKVLDLVGLSVWLEQLPENINTVLGANATTISGGERRRLLLARALCSTASVLLIDEPAEHLDPATADALIADLITACASMDSPRSLIVATHRLSPMQHASEVLILDSGVVRDRGTHKELLERDETYRAALAAEHMDLGVTP